MDDERPATLESQPEMLTLMEAASVLRIGRTTAYQLAAEYLRTSGKRGLPVVRVGRQLRILRSDLDDVMKHGTTRTTQPSHPARRRRSQPRSEVASHQPRLFG